MMEMITVKSSNLKAVGYDEMGGNLHVEFQTGTFYVYRQVPKELYTRLLKAPSIGSFFMKNVMGAFKCQKMSPDGKS